VQGVHLDVGARRRVGARAAGERQTTNDKRQTTHDNRRTASLAESGTTDAEILAAAQGFSLRPLYY
jgi:hypothetical protein